MEKLNSEKKEVLYTETTFVKAMVCGFNERITE